MTRYKVVKGKRLGSVLVKQFSRALPGWGLGASPQYYIIIIWQRSWLLILQYCIGIGRYCQYCFYHFMTSQITKIVEK